VDVTVDAIPGRHFAGKISEIQPAATVASRSFVVKVRVPNPQGVLRPGMFARGTVTTAVRRDVLQIPDTAVLLTAGKPIVFVVQDGKAVRREVAVEQSQNGTVVVERGVNEGDQVVISGAEGLTDNQPVTSRAPQQ
jgi:membrane fusion protein (multidrug efflux system)